MKKAIWLRLPRFKTQELPDQPADPLAQYRRRRSASRRTPERAEQERLYRARVNEWLRRPENRWCRVYLALSDLRVPATECHHYQGRRGRLLLYEPFWLPVSREGHRWIHEHRDHARVLGLLCPLGLYNSQVHSA